MITRDMTSNTKFGPKSQKKGDEKELYPFVRSLFIIV
ncbi:unnamed protein product [Larinioides sclopetarius]|uniref:Photosystem II protein L n=1 Tax=Larinioides sclopetarius TaxID=280406 RepID=A0AAV2B4C9_9ARAC